MPLSKEDRDAALARAKELEKDEPLPREKAVGVFKEGLTLGQRLHRLLSPSAWFMQHSKECCLPHEDSQEETPARKGKSRKKRM